MTTTYKTPGVFIEEVSIFPPSVAEVETAIPAFIGYTKQAKQIVDDDLHMKPTKIYSLKEYEAFFGGPKEDDSITITVQDDPSRGYIASSFSEPVLQYLMYYSMQMFFDNGGGQCYVVSVNKYDSPLNETDLENGLATVGYEDEPTLIVIPEATKLTPASQYQQLVGKALDQCGRLRDRFGIFDLYDGMGDATATGERIHLSDQHVSDNRSYFGSSDNLKYGSVYYPFIKTTNNFFVNKVETNVNVTYTKSDGTTGYTGSLAGCKTSNTALYNFVKNELKKHYIVLPPSSAIAGVYAATDSSRGVWKAPANMGLQSVIEPVIKLDDTKQGLLNVDADTGKSINALRAFAGKGTFVWGARTLAGNDNEWRYISVRRFYNMVEESVKKSTYWAVFEPNSANTWVKVRGMIENYLMQKWREGALAGATPKNAYFVRCGLGTTMDSQDVLEGRMNVEIGMAVVRPAEFIILKFSHKMQTS